MKRGAVDASWRSRQKDGRETQKVKKNETKTAGMDESDRKNVGRDFRREIKDGR